MAFGADQVVMLLVAIAFFVLSEVLSELVFTYQVALDKQIKGIINCRAAYPVILVLHANVKRFNIEMAVP
jgi:hypothetical protein